MRMFTSVHRVRRMAVTFMTVAKSQTRVCLSDQLMFAPLCLNLQPWVTTCQTGLFAAAAAAAQQLPHTAAALCRTVMKESGGREQADLGAV